MTYNHVCKLHSVEHEIEQSYMFHGAETTLWVFSGIFIFSDTKLSFIDIFP